MRTFRIEPDANDEPTLWRYADWDDTMPEPIVRRCDIHPVLWALAEQFVAESVAGAALRISVAVALVDRGVSP